MKKYIQRNALQGKEIVAVVSGSNVNFDRLRHVAERAEVGEHREAIVGVAIPEKQGSFRRFCRALGKRNITEFNYRQASNGVAHIYAGVQTTSFEDRQKVLSTLRKADYDVTDMTDNETAKLHVRHMVGGRVQGDRQELIYRFVFPERPGALMQFLTGLGAKWDITLFHYRNHGAAWGRVLVGFSAADTANKKDRRELNKFLDRIGYRYWDETDNPAYDLFLR
jgi:threonine dehydratase